MARIKIKDLPKDKKISKAEMEKIKGGAIGSTTYVGPSTYPLLAAKLPQGWGMSAILLGG